MFTDSISMSFLFLIVIVISLLQTTHSVSSKSTNASLFISFSPGVATWYDEPLGSGSGAACGFDHDVDNAPYYGMTSAGNQFLFRSGKGCGNCYQIKCTNNPVCSGNPITITMTNECPGECNNDAVHFDLSGKAFGSLAKPGKGDVLRNVGRIDIHYKSVQCRYRTPITFKIEKWSNPYYLAFAMEGLNGDGDVGSAEIRSSYSKNWIVMSRSYGESWSVGLPSGIKGPCSIRIRTIESSPII